MNIDKFSFQQNATGYKITTDPLKIDIDILHYYLSKEAYWSKDIPKNLVRNSIKHSLNFSLLDPNNIFIGFARVVTDYYTFGWLADVFIDKSYRGQGLGKWLVQTVINHPKLQSLRNFLLFTKDAHGLYEQFGWKYLERPEILLAKRKSLEEIINMDKTN
ncbi:MAG: GNAT family N-acetyltransferase [Candidatus Hodarchaeales archaeon]|jgi:GNAT superfamily N-acetyltransferase